jgi:hypothetical protein
MRLKSTAKLKSTSIVRFGEERKGKRGCVGVRELGITQGNSTMRRLEKCFISLSLSNFFIRLFSI